MPIQFNCPQGHLLAAQDAMTGQMVGCPICQAVVRVPALVSADPKLVVQGEKKRERRRHDDDEEDDYADRPRKKKKKPRYDDEPRPRMDLGKHPYRLVRVGLALHFSWILVYLLSIALGLFAMIASVDGGRSIAGLLRVAFILFSIGLFVGRPILGIIGSVLCWRVPSGSGSRPFFIVTMCLDAVSLAFGIGFFLMAGLAGRGGPDAGIAVLVILGAAYVTNLLSWVFMMVGVRLFAHYVKAYAVHAEGFDVLIRGTSLLAAPFVYVPTMQLIAHAMGRGAAPVLVFISYGLVLAWIAGCVTVFVQNLNLLSKLREKLQEEMERFG